MEILSADSPQGQARAAEVLRQGGVVAFPTETVYGLGADAANPAALEKLRELKSRDGAQPFQILVPSVELAKKLCGKIPVQAERIMSFWPGALTLILPAAEGGTIGLRVPDHAFTQGILAAFGKPLAATSANLRGEPPLSSAEAVAQTFPSGVELALSEEAKLGVASSVVRVDNLGIVEILRDGAISREAILERAAGRA